MPPDSRTGTRTRWGGREKKARVCRAGGRDQQAALPGAAGALPASSLCLEQLAVGGSNGPQAGNVGLVSRASLLPLLPWPFCEGLPPGPLSQGHLPCWVTPTQRSHCHMSTVERPCLPPECEPQGGALAPAPLDREVGSAHPLCGMEQLLQEALGGRGAGAQVSQAPQVEWWLLNLLSEGARLGSHKALFARGRRSELATRCLWVPKVLGLLTGRAAFNQGSAPTADTQDAAPSAHARSGPKQVTAGLGARPALTYPAPPWRLRARGSQAWAGPIPGKVVFVIHKGHSCSEGRNGVNTLPLGGG